MANNSSEISYPSEGNADYTETIKQGVLIFVCSFGLVCNIFIIVLAARYTARKNLHYLIINMAVSDTLFICANIVYEILISYPFPLTKENKILEILCYAFHIVARSSYITSLLTLLVISIHRFRATRRTFQRSRPSTLQQRVAVISICWLIPMLMNGYLVKAARVYGSCDLSINLDDLKLSLMIYVLGDLAQLMICAIICLVIFSLSIATIRSLSRSQSIDVHVNQEQRTMRNKRTKSAVWMVLSSLCLFIVCWLPYYVTQLLYCIFYYLYRFHHSKVNVYEMIDFMEELGLHYAINRFLPLVNSAFSPCIYIIFLSDFREAAKKVLCRCKTSTDNVNADRSIELQ